MLSNTYVSLTFNLFHPNFEKNNFLARIYHSVLLSKLPCGKTLLLSVQAVVDRVHSHYLTKLGSQCTTTNSLSICFQILLLLYFLQNGSDCRTDSKQYEQFKLLMRTYLSHCSKIQSHYFILKTRKAVRLLKPYLKNYSNCY